MSSSEPRLSIGDGTPELRAQGVPVPPAAGSAATPPTPPSTPTPTLPPTTSSPATSSPTTPRPIEATPARAAVPTRADHDALPPLLSLGDLLLEAPAWLFSAALHLAAIILLGLLFVVPERPLEILLRLDDYDGFEELSGDEFDMALEVESMLDAAPLETASLLEPDDPVLVEPTELQPSLLESESLLVSSPIESALSGRSEGMQEQLLEAYGGNASTQRAVLLALRWLERYQSSQGMWSLTGNYTGGAGVENREAATGLALLAFQGAGYTPAGDPQHDFTKVTARAWKTLLRKQGEDGSFFQSGRHNAQLYTQAICTIAVCELYGMTQDSRYREPAQRAIDYCVRVQASEGGWRYYPGSGSDLSVTGWFAMALQSARMAGLEVPSPTLAGISRYLDSVSSQGGIAYSYQPNSAPTACMTAEGLLCRQYLGWEQSDRRLRKGADYLIKNLPVWEEGQRDVYFWYYATQVCHHMEGHHWRTWNEAMKAVLPAHQVESGRERGSWDPQGDEWGSEGGRLYVTCLSTYMLEVYYRHLPIYQTRLMSGPR
jgi:hypothetical protein